MEDERCVVQKSLGQFSFESGMLGRDSFEVVGALVLVNPLGDVFGLVLACQHNGRRVGGVGSAKVQVMGSLLDIDWGRIFAHVESDATSLPRVELAVREHNVGGLDEVSVRESSTEEIKSPVVLGSLTVGTYAVLVVLGFIPIVSGEHRVFGVRREGHGHLVAVQNVPAVLTNSLHLRSINVEAFRGTFVVNEDVVDSLKGDEAILKAVWAVWAAVLLNLLFSYTTGVSDGPRREGVEEVGRIGVVNHDHGADVAVQDVAQVINIVSGFGDLAQLEDVSDVLVVGGVFCHRVKHDESVFDGGGAAGIVAFVDGGGNSVVGVRVDVAIEEQNGGTGGERTLEPLRVLETKPSSQHAAVGASAHDDGSVLHGLVLLERLDKLNVITHGLLDRQVLKLILVVGVVTEGQGLSEVSMLAEDDEGVELLGKSGGHEAGVVPEGPDVTLVTSVENNGALSIIVRIINQVPHAVGISSSTLVVKVVNSSVKPLFLRVARVVLLSVLGLDFGSSDFLALVSDNPLSTLGDDGVGAGEAEGCKDS